MSLPALSWKALPTVNVAVQSSVASVKDAILAALASTTYLDGSIRTPGAGIAWTATALANNVVKCVPSAANNARNIQALLGCGAVGSSQAVAFGATYSGAYQSQYMGVSLAIDGNYLTDNVANPVAPGGRFYGWTYGSKSIATAATNAASVRILESADILCVSIVHVDGSVMPTFIGAIVDAETGSLIDTESDGKLYGVISPGASISNTTQLNDNNFHSYTYSYLGTGAANAPSAGVFSPGTSTIMSLRRFGAISLPETPTGTSNSLQTLSGKFMRMPIYVSTGDNFVGRLREIWLFKRAMHGLIVRSGGVDRGMLLGRSVISTSDAVLLTY